MFLLGMEMVCDITIVLAETDWNECWTSEATIGRGLAEGTFHGCTTYTGTAGVRQRFLEFSAPITSMNKVWTFFDFVAYSRRFPRKLS